MFISNPDRFLEGVPLGGQQQIEFLRAPAKYSFSCSSASCKSGVSLTCAGQRFQFRYTPSGLRSARRWHRFLFQPEGPRMHFTYQTFKDLRFLSREFT